MGRPAAGATQGNVEKRVIGWMLKLVIREMMNEPFKISLSRISRAIISEAIHFKEYHA
jgi:hypothetical protein